MHKLQLILITLFVTVGGIYFSYLLYPESHMFGALNFSVDKSIIIENAEKLAHASGISTEGFYTDIRLAYKNSLIRQILQLAELEAKSERIAEEFGRTNRKVNVLRDIIIPNYHERIHAITEKLDSEVLEELVRLKVSRNILERKRQ